MNVLFESNQMTRQLFGYAGWFAYASATATIATFVSAFLFFSLGQPFGTLNDIAAVFQLIFMLPLALIFYQIFRPLFYAGGLLMVISYSTWALWLGRVFVAGNTAAAHMSGV